MRTNAAAPVLALSLALAAPAACSSGPGLPKATGEAALVVGGDVRGGPYRLGPADVDALTPGKARGADPATGRTGLWEGADLAAIEERVELERGADTLVVRAADGQAVAIPLTVVRQLRPVLAQRADGERLPAPQLAWPNVPHHGLTTDPRAARWWIRGVVRLDFVAWGRVYGRALRIPEGAPGGALAGARTYGMRCIGCHGLRGAGGAVGPELARGGPFTDPARLRELLRGHPGWEEPNVVGPPADARADELAAFLRVVAVAPADDDEAER